MKVILAIIFIAIIGFMALTMLYLYIRQTLLYACVKTKEIRDTDVLAFAQKYPLVTLDFMKQPTREQNIENNQEIHELNIKLEQIKNRISAIEIDLKMKPKETLN